MIPIDCDFDYGIDFNAISSHVIPPVFYFMEHGSRTIKLSLSVSIIGSVSPNSAGEKSLQKLIVGRHRHSGTTDIKYL